MPVIMTGNKTYWDNFYKTLALSVPSQFCAMVAVELPDEPVIVELGCGNGRDSLYFASRGAHVYAMDLSQEAIESCSDGARARGLDHATFVKGDLSNRDDVAALFEKARENDRELVAYSRFVMHSINDKQERRFMDNLKREMVSGERIYLEFRSLEDAKLKKTYGDHYRRFVDTEAFVSAMEDRNFRTLYRLTGQGMARFHDEDPFVSRVVFERV